MILDRVLRPLEPSLLVLESILEQLRPVLSRHQSCLELSLVEHIAQVLLPLAAFELAFLQVGVEVEVEVLLEYEVAGFQVRWSVVVQVGLPELLMV